MALATPLGSRLAASWAAARTMSSSATAVASVADPLKPWRMRLVCLAKSRPSLTSGMFLIASQPAFIC